MTQAQAVGRSTAVDDLTVLLPGWRTHLRARNVAPGTIATHLRVGEDLPEHLRGVTAASFVR